MICPACQQVLTMGLRVKVLACVTDTTACVWRCPACGHTQGLTGASYDATAVEYEPSKASMCWLDEWSMVEVPLSEYLPDTETHHD